MIGLLIADLDKEMTEAETQEKDSQADYEALMKESAEKRASDSKSLGDKQSAKADLEVELQKLKGTLREGKELGGGLWWGKRGQTEDEEVG